MMNSFQDHTHIRHQLRNRINNISMQTELARLQLEQSLPTQTVVVSLERILQECKSCAEFINEWAES